MRKIIYHVAITLDGFLARQDGSFDFFPTAGDHIADYVTTLTTAYGAVVMGRHTYEVGLRVGVTDPYPHLATYVVSSTMTASPDARVTLVRDDVEGAMRRLREQPGKDIYLAGGGQLASRLLAAGLVDEVWLKVNPVLLGAGIPLAPGLGSPLPLRLLSTRVYDSGVVLTRYAVGAEAPPSA